MQENRNEEEKTNRDHRGKDIILEKKKRIQMSETFLVGVLLAFAGGFLDAYTYLFRDHVFANAQTGNIVLLGMNLAEGKIRQAMIYLIPILTFSFGIAASEWIRARAGKKNSLHWRQVALLFEIVILIAVSGIPSGPWNMAANVMVSFVCAMQVQSFRKMNGCVYATTMCTGNLRSGTELLLRYFKTKERQAGVKGLQYYGIIFSFIAGAGLGAVWTQWLGQWALLLAAAVLFAAFGLMFRKRNRPPAATSKNRTI